jgi:hypothetical protein
MQMRFTIDLEVETVVLRRNESDAMRHGRSRAAIAADGASSVLQMQRALRGFERRSGSSPRLDEVGTLAARGRRAHRRRFTLHPRKLPT